jgi:VanZ family protein
MPRAWRVIFRWLPALLWMGVIFAASSDRGSFQHSSRIIEPVVRWFFPHISEEALHTIIVVVRKGCHAGEYALLAALLFWALGGRRGAEGRTQFQRRAALALLLAILFAASDEWHQSFVPSREASVRDVLVDATGAAAALGLLAWTRPRPAAK